MLILAPAIHAQDMPLAQIIIPSESWKKVEGTFGPISALSVRPVEPTQVMIWDAKDKLMAMIDHEGKSIAKREGEFTNHPRRVYPENGFMYEVGTDRKSLQIMKGPDYKEKVGEVPLKVGDAAVTVRMPDNGSMLIGDAAGKHIWMYRVNRDGTLSGGEKYITLRVLPYHAPTLKEKQPEEPRSGVCAIRSDKAGRIYAATKIGVQVFDPTGRLCGVLTNPSKNPVTGMAFAGPKGDLLFIACGDEIYMRRINAVWAFFDEKLGATKGK
ncbi:MAG: SMP-30/gluconolactonase/LRE family protein [Planctomycetes bacterium]|nr:SMP-30/gluconolactonase/LRE family protein [Planctomycetota bacterium]